MKIRTSLFISFSVVILLLVSSGIFFILTQINFKNQYKTTVGTITSEYMIIDSTKKITSIYISLLQDINNQTQLNNYKQISSEINNTFLLLDTKIKSNASIDVYKRIKNKVRLLQEYINQGISNTKKEDFSQSSNILDQINRGEEGIREDIANLIIIELSYAKEQQNKLQVLENYIGIISILVFLGVLIGSILITIKFSNRLSNPLVKLSKLAKSIADGNLEMSVDENLLNYKNEIGSLSKSFNIMLFKLKEKILAVEKEKSNAENLVVIRTKELSDEKSRLIYSINSLKIGFAIIGIDGNFIVNNPSLLNILKIKEGSISLDDITKYLKIEGESLFERLKRCTKDKCIVEINEIMFGINYLRLFLNPVFSLKGVPIGGVLLLEDITEEKVLERSRDEFFAVASHELRTPLTAIRFNTEMMLGDYKDKIQDKEIREMLTDVNEASVRLIGIVNDFLEVSRLEQGNISFEKTNFNIIELTEKVIISLRAEAEKKNILLEIIKPENLLPEVFADKTRIDQVLFNLIGNSLKFTDKGSIKINFEIINNNDLKVRVTDTGKGISVKNESLLFRKFQPAGDDVLARDVTKSTGLGLYISKILIDKMGGTIGLEKTEAGVGSTFFFTIPLAS